MNPKRFEFFRILERFWTSISFAVVFGVGSLFAFAVRFLDWQFMTASDRRQSQSPFYTCRLGEWLFGFWALAPFAVVFFVVVFVKGDTLLAGGSVTRLLACLLVSGCVFILTPRVTNLTARVLSLLRLWSLIVFWLAITDRASSISGHTRRKNRYWWIVSDPPYGLIMICILDRGCGNRRFQQQLFKIQSKSKLLRPSILLIKRNINCKRTEHNVCPGFCCL